MDQETPPEDPESYWIRHCESKIAQGLKPKRYQDLPEYLKTERMKQYYIELKKRLR